jgi:zinc/manganese transport system substrate-binding protein
LVATDPASGGIYDANAARYTARLDALEGEVKAEIAKIPAARRRVISTHDAFGYFEAAYGIHFIAPQGVSTESETSARDVGLIIGQIRKQSIPAVFLENVSDPRLMRQIASETGAKIGGVLYSDALTDADGEAPTYIDLIRHNVKQLAGALLS